MPFCISALHLFREETLGKISDLDSNSAIDLTLFSMSSFSHFSAIERIPSARFTSLARLKAMAERKKVSDWKKFITVPQRVSFAHCYSAQFAPDFPCHLQSLLSSDSSSPNASASWRSFEFATNISSDFSTSESASLRKILPRWFPGSDSRSLDPANHSHIVALYCFIDYSTVDATSMIRERSSLSKRSHDSLTDW